MIDNWDNTVSPMYILKGASKLGEYANQVQRILYQSNLSNYNGWY